MTPGSRTPDTPGPALPASDAPRARLDAHGPDASPDPLLDRLRALRGDVPPSRDLWPDIAIRLERRSEARAMVRRTHRRRHVAYAAAAALVLAVAAGWQVLPLRDAGAPAASTATAGSPAPPAAPPGTAVPASADTEAPLLRAADALALEYQGALREVQVNTAFGADRPMTTPAQAAAVAELDRSAAEVRAALARDPDALHLFHRLQRIHAHRLALTLRQVPLEESHA